MAMTLAVLSLFAVSCNPEDNPVKGPLVAPVLSVSPSSIVIDEYSDNPALTFTWADVAKESGAEVAYSLQITQTGDNDFASGTSYNIPSAEGTITKAFSSNELKTLAGEIGADIKAGFELMARVRVTAQDLDAVISNVVTANVAEAALPIDHLYPIGEATNWGWNQDNAEEMTNNGGVFTWEGHLYGNAEFKFLCQLGGVWWPGVVRDADAKEYWTAKVGYGDDDDVKFKVEESGTYKVTIDAKNSNAMTITAEFIKADPKVVVEELYVLGSASDAGWSLDDMEAFTNDNGVFTWEGNLKANDEFRFPMQKISNVWWPCLMISEDGSGIVYGVSDGDKAVYKLEEDGTYKIVINAKDFDNMSYTIERTGDIKEKPKQIENLYVLGGACDTGWSLDDMVAFTNDNGVFTWEGHLKANDEFRFPMKKDWWPCLMISADGKSIVWGNGDDDKTGYTVAAEGNYKIVINAKDMNNITVEITLLP